MRPPTTPTIFKFNCVMSAPSLPLHEEPSTGITTVHYCVCQLGNFETPTALPTAAIKLIIIGKGTLTAGTIFIPTRRTIQQQQFILVVATAPCRINLIFLTTAARSAWVVILIVHHQVIN